MSRRHLGSVIDPGRPDWVLVGCPGELPPDMGGGAGVWLYASKDLTRAELEAEVSETAYRMWEEECLASGLLSGLPPPQPEYRITATMRRFIVIMARDYQAAFAALFKQWSPEPDPRRALGGQAAIEEGR